MINHVIAEITIFGRIYGKFDRNTKKVTILQLILLSNSLYRGIFKVRRRRLRNKIFAGRKYSKDLDEKNKRFNTKLKKTFKTFIKYNRSLLIMNQNFQFTRFFFQIINKIACLTFTNTVRYSMISTISTISNLSLTISFPCDLYIIYYNILFERGAFK